MKPRKGFHRLQGLYILVDYFTFVYRHSPFNNFLKHEI